MIMKSKMDDIVIDVSIVDIDQPGVVDICDVYVLTHVMSTC